MWGGGILKNNNLKSSQNNDVLSFTKTLQNQKNIKNQNILKDINILKNRNTSKNIENSISNSFAFSLIELSIVLIIIGLLVAGVTGGKSLIESARIREYLNEIRDYQQNIYVFQAATNRYPGDKNNDGKFGQLSGESYTTSSFPAPYDGSTYPTPSLESGPFVDLYLEKIIDFQPKGNSTAITSAARGVPISRIFKKNYFTFRYFNNFADYKNTVTLDLWGGLSTSIAKKIDEKIDDGNDKKGDVYCHNAKYDNNTDSCSEFIFPAIKLK